MYTKWLILIISFVSSCSNDRPKAIENLSDVQVETKVAPTPTSEGLKDLYVKKEGWEIPRPSKKDFEETKEIEYKTTDGRPVKVTVYSYTASEDLFIRDPIEEVGERGLGLLKIGLISELKFKNKIFCYAVMFNRTQISSDTGKPVSVGPGSVFRYWDMDGDGKFETLSFGGEAGLPTWVSQDGL